MIKKSTSKMKNGKVGGQSGLAETYLKPSQLSIMEHFKKQPTIFPKVSKYAFDHYRKGTVS